MGGLKRKLKVVKERDSETEEQKMLARRKSSLRRKSAMIDPPKLIS